MCQFDQGRQFRLRIRRVPISDAGSVRTDSGFVLPKLRPPNAGVGNNFIETDFDKPRPGRQDRVVVTATLLPRDEDLLRKPLAMRQPLNPPQILARQNRRRPQRQSRRRPARHKPGLRPRRFSNLPRSRRLKLFQRHPLCSPLTKRLNDLTRHRSSTQPGHCPGGINNRLNPERSVNGHDSALSLQVP